METISSSGKYIAFLRGINVGGRHKVPMVELKKALKSIGLQNAKTLLNSGNVAFEANHAQKAQLTTDIAGKLETTFGFSIPVIIRTSEELAALMALAPFRDINITKDTRLYASFLGEKIQKTPDLPYAAPDGAFTILSVFKETILSVLDLSKTGTVDGMKILESTFGKNLTTRNWNTVEKLEKL